MNMDTPLERLMVGVATYLMLCERYHENPVFDTDGFVDYHSTHAKFLTQRLLAESINTRNESSSAKDLGASTSEGKVLGEGSSV